jgi:hypothetical protein
MPEITPLYEIESSTTTEFVEQPGFLENRRIEAIKSLEIVPTPEINEAVIGYYNDHYALARTIDMALSGSLEVNTTDSDIDYDEIERQTFPPTIPSPEVAIGLIGHAYQRNELEQTPASKETMLRMIAGTLRSTLFQETSIGVTTLQPREVELVGTLFDKLAIETKSTKLRLDRKEDILNAVKAKQEHFWEDVRYAGQLEFHNTGHLDDISRSSAIMPRTEQYRRTNAMNAQMSPDRTIMHSIVPHFSELFDPHTYKIGDTDKRYTGTVALPLASIIETAPYARDAHYAVATLKEPKDIPLNHGETSIGRGNDDLAGRGGADRVFFAAPTPDEADHYALEVDNRATLIFVGSTEVTSSADYGLGENYARRLLIADEQHVASAVDALQADYLTRPEYASKVILPLRRGLFTYRAESMPSNIDTYRKKNNVANPLLVA